MRVDVLIQCMCAFHFSLLKCTRQVPASRAKRAKLFIELNLLLLLFCDGSFRSAAK